MRRRRLLLIAVGFTGSLAACGDPEAPRSAGDVGATFAVGTDEADTTTGGRGAAPKVSPGDADTIAADLDQSLMASYGPDATFDMVIGMFSERCRAELDLEQAMRDHGDEILEGLKGVAVDDVTIRHIDGPRAQAEVVSTNPQGIVDGALAWTDIVLEDGHWRLDHCENGTYFEEVGRTLEAPVTAPITEADEEDIARSIEAQYLGRGPSADAWNFLSTDCRRIEWGDDQHTHDSVFASLGAEIAGQDVTFAVEAVTLEPASDTRADASLVVVHNGLRVDMAITGQSLRFEYEDGRWRYDDCIEP